MQAPTYVCTPWQDARELLKVRDQLYDTLGSLEDGFVHNAGNEEQHNILPNQEHDFSQLHHDKIVDLNIRKDPRFQERDAINRVLAWEERGEVPLAINSTVLLVEAVLYDDVRRNSQMAIRMTYSTAILRFVTGICDAQQSTHSIKQSMLQIAVLLQLPAELVEARHSISHKELPSLTQLRTAARLGLQWLWSWYWQKLDDVIASTETGRRQPQNQVQRLGDEELVTLKSKLQVVLKKYISERKAEVKKRATTLEAAKLASIAVLELCSGNEAGGDQAWSILLRLLVDEGMIIPSDKKLGTTMSGAFLLWDALLLRLSFKTSTSSPSMYYLFTTHIFSILRTSTDAASSTHEALSQWLLHVIASPEWTKQSQLPHASSPSQVQQSMLEKCFTHPTHWTIILVKGILTQCADESMKSDWWPLVEAVAGDGDGDHYMSDAEANASQNQDESTKIEENTSTEIEGIEKQQQLLLLEEDETVSLRPLAPGWGVWRGHWGRRPIGELIS